MVYIKNKIILFYIHYLSGNYFILYLFLGIQVDFILIAKSFTYGGTIIKFGWFLQTILIYYMIFLLIYLIYITDFYKMLINYCRVIILLYVISI